MPAAVLKIRDLDQARQIVTRGLLKLHGSQTCADYPRLS
jgi:hypothetical protein